MLRITATPRPDGCTVALEGRLAGPWVDEVASYWRSLVAVCEPSSVRIDLEAVTFIDVPGKALLRIMHAEGTILAARACMTRAILDEVAGDGCAAYARSERKEERS